jgi:lysophospholipase
LARSGRPTLAYALFEPTAPALAAVIVTPGLGEHVGRYAHVGDAWAARGFLTCVYDARGNGHSQGVRAHIDRFDDYGDDAVDLLDELDTLTAWRDLGAPIVFGHSLGALISLHLVLRAPQRFRALALSSPFLAQALATPAWKKTLGRWVSGFWPTYSDRTDIVGAMVTGDPERARLLDEDPLRVGRVTARWFTEVEAAQVRLFERASSFDLPVFCLAAGADVIADVDATHRFFDRLPSRDKELRIVVGQRHELHQETGRDAHITAFADVFERWAETPP